MKCTLNDLVPGRKVPDGSRKSESDLSLSGTRAPRPELPKLRKTERGFGILEFTDVYDAECSLQESSSVTPRIWFGADGERMHLGVEDVKALLPLLQHFVDTGRLP